MNKTKRAVLVIDEVAGKQICHLSLAEPYTRSSEVYLPIEFDDETKVLIEVDCCRCFGITHRTRDPHGEMQVVKNRCTVQSDRLRRACRDAAWCWRSFVISANVVARHSVGHAQLVAPEPLLALPRE